MDAAVPSDSERAFEHALNQFHALLNLREVDELQPFGPATVYTALVTVWLLVYQRLHAGASLADAVARLLECDPQALPATKRVREKTLSPNTAAFSQARRRLKPEITDRVAEAVFDSLVAATTPTLDGRRVFLLDGTTIKLPPTAPLQAAFPPAANQFGAGVWPVAQLLVAHEWESGCALLPEIGPMYGPEATSELRQAQAVVQRLPPGSVVVGDSNFGVFSVAFAAARAGHDVLLRLTQARFAALRKRATALDDAAGERRWKLTWTPSARELASHPELPRDAAVEVQLRERVLSPELTLWLVTTLPGPVTDLYGRRGDIETDIRDVKVTLKTEELRVKSPAMLRKELAASITAYNLVIQLRRLAAKTANVPPRRLSFTRAWGVLRIILVEPPLRTSADWRRRFELALRIIRQSKIPNRPGRSYPRQALARRNKSTSGKRKKPPPEVK